MSLFRSKEEKVYIVAGLGNPGKKYERSRHNCGWLAVDRIAERRGASIKRARFDALTAELRIAGERVVLMKPTTFMNLSGVAVEKAAKYYKVPPERVIVIFDDISLAPGSLRIRADGSAGGHNGMKSVIEQLGSDSFPRIKIGVGEKPNREYPLADYVLSTPTSAEREAILSRLDDVDAAVELIIKGELQLAQSRYNG